jgi:hypothetical protein
MTLLYGYHTARCAGVVQVISLPYRHIFFLLFIEPQATQALPSLIINN